jgi:nucleotide-binding universal stress UspA family protein
VATCEVRAGQQATELLDVIAPTDLVVMTSHGRGGVRRWLLGSVADKLVREAAGPVLLVRARPPEQG